MKYNRKILHATSSQDNSYWDRSYLDTQHVLVKAPCKMGVKQETIQDSFSNYPSNKSEVAQMIRVDAAIWIWLESASIFSGGEKSIIGVEHFFRQYSKELP